MLLFKISTTLVFGFSQDDLTVLQGNLQKKEAPGTKILTQGSVRGLSAGSDLLSVW